MIAINPEFKNTIEHLISIGKESDFCDFKQKWHEDNEKLLHDILCFANTVHDKNCYIIIGVSNTGEIVGVSEDNRKDQANILDLLSNTSFAGDNTPNVKLDKIILKDKEIDVITVLNSYDTPFYLKSKSKSYNKIKEGYIYTREGDKNTSISQNSNYQEIEMLWKKRLGLTQPPLNQIVNRLNNKFEWTRNEDVFYNNFNPEFQLVIEEDEADDRKRGEFYVYSQTNSGFFYSNLQIMYKTTLLKKIHLVSLDGGNYITPIPEWGFISHTETNLDSKYIYKYYLKDSIAYKLQNFLFNETDQEEVWIKSKFDEIVLYFENEEEHSLFKCYIERDPKIVEIYLKKARGVYFEIDTNNEKEKKDCKYKLSVGLALNEILKQFRSSMAGNNKILESKINELEDDAEYTVKQLKEFSDSNKDKNILFVFDNELFDTSSYYDFRDNLKYDEKYKLLCKSFGYDNKLTTIYKSYTTYYLKHKKSF